MPEPADLLRFGGIALIVFFLLRMQMRRERSRRKEQRREQAPTRVVVNKAGDSNSPAASRGAELLELELHATARDVLAEIQTKTATLQQLILDANQATERLENAIQNGERSVRDVAV